MKVVVLKRPGGVEALETIERPVPSIGPADILIRTKVMAVSRPDILIRKGIYAWMPPLPASPGNELVGVVEAVGDNVDSVTPGEAVLLSARDLPVRGGCYTEFICVPAHAAYLLPNNVDFDQAVVLPTYLVAYAMLHDMGLRPGVRSVFVVGAAGSVGGALVELAKAEGLVVIGSVGSQERAAHVRSLGVDHVVNYKTEPVVQRVLDLTGGRGVDVIFDHIIGRKFAGLFDALADFGTVVFYNIHAPMPDEDVFDKMRETSVKSPALRCFNIHTYDRRPAERQRLMKRVIDLFAAGRIKPRVGARLPMSQAAEAHQLLESGAIVGKIVMHP